MRNLSLWRKNLTPFRDDWFSTMDKYMEDWSGARTPAAMSESQAWNPLCKVSETPSAYMLKFDLPGVKKDQIKVDLNENRLTVSGERKEETNKDDEKSHFSEVFYGSFMRSFIFPTTVDAEKVEAKYDNGVLTITLNKEANGGTRQISVK